MLTEYLIDIFFFCDFVGQIKSILAINQTNCAINNDEVTAHFKQNDLETSGQHFNNNLISPTVALLRQRF